MMSDIISFYICSRDCQCKADNPAPYANLLNQQGTARRHSLCSWSEVPLTSTNQAATAASLPKLKTHRSTPSHRAITQLDCYITAKVHTCTVDMHKVVTQFVPIAAVKTVEVLTSDLKKQTSLKMETYFQAFKLSTDALVIFQVFRRLLEPIWLSYDSPSWVCFLRRWNHPETVDFCFEVPSILCCKLLVWMFSPSWFLPHDSLLDLFWPTLLNTTPSQLLIFSLKQFS